MAKDPIFDYDDSAERRAFDAPVWNAEKARKSLLAHLDRAITAAKDPSAKVRKNPIKHRNGHVELSLPHPLTANGKTSIVRKAEEIEGTVADLIYRIGEGVYDEAIKLAHAGEAVVTRRRRKTSK